MNKIKLQLLLLSSCILFGKVPSFANKTIVTKKDIKIEKTKIIPESKKYDDLSEQINYINGENEKDEKVDSKKINLKSVATVINSLGILSICLVSSCIITIVGMEGYRTLRQLNETLVDTKSNIQEIFINSTNLLKEIRETIPQFIDIINKIELIVEKFAKVASNNLGVFNYNFAIFIKTFNLLVLRFHETFSKFKFSGYGLSVSCVNLNIDGMKEQIEIIMNYVQNLNNDALSTLED